jgi:hypothetical protein
MSISYTPSTRSFLISGHVTTHSRKLPFKSANSPFAERWRIADRKHPLSIPLRRFFLAEWYFVTKLDPQLSLSPVPFFGVNNKVLFFLSTTPFWGGVYGLENWCARPKSWQKVSK